MKYVDGDGGGHGAAFPFMAGTGGYLQWLATACCLLSLAVGGGYLETDVRLRPPHFPLSPGLQQL